MSTTNKAMNEFARKELTSIVMRLTEKYKSHKQVKFQMIL